SISENIPNNGFPVMPEKESEAPHLSPTTNFEEGSFCLLNFCAYSTSSPIISRPVSISLQTSCRLRYLTLLLSYFPITFLHSCMLLFSQPRPLTSTLAALG